MQLTLDVHLDFDEVALAALHDPTRTIYEASQQAAIEESLRRHVRLRQHEPIETVVKHAREPLTGRDVMLVSTRWVADT